MKKCFKCRVEKELSEFYKHPGMWDGYLGKCKECNKTDVRENYRKNIQHYIEYEKKRGNKRNLKQFKTNIPKKKKKYKDIVYKAWKGTKGEYRKLHYWVEGQLGRPKLCSECKSSDGNTRRFHWANISGEYKREIKDWIRLCAHCHKLKDNNS